MPRYGHAPDPSTIDWRGALAALHHAAFRVPVKQHDRTPEQQEAVAEFSRRMVQVSELLNGPELGMLDAPLHDECSADEFLVVAEQVSATASREQCVASPDYDQPGCTLEPGHSGEHLLPAPAVSAPASEGMVQIFIDGQSYRVRPEVTGQFLISLRHRPEDAWAVWRESLPEDIDAGWDRPLNLAGGERFYTTPKYINASAPAEPTEAQINALINNHWSDRKSLGANVAAIWRAARRESPIPAELDLRLAAEHLQRQRNAAWEALRNVAEGYSWDNAEEGCLAANQMRDAAEGFLADLGSTASPVPAERTNVIERAKAGVAKATAGALTDEECEFYARAVLAEFAVPPAPVPAERATDDDLTELIELPRDLARVLQDPSIIIRQDAAVFELIAKWQNAPCITESAPVAAPVPAAEATEQPLCDADEETLRCAQCTDEEIRAHLAMHAAGRCPVRSDGEFAEYRRRLGAAATGDDIEPAAGATDGDDA